MAVALSIVSTRDESGRDIKRDNNCRKFADRAKRISWY